MATRARLITQPAWHHIAEDQDGVISRRQLLDLGLTSDQARQWVRTGRWLPVHPGIYATRQLSDRARVWAAVLHCGRDAAAHGPTALWLAGAEDTAPSLVHVAVPVDRKVVACPGIVVHRTRRPSTHPSANPPRTRIEQAVLACCAAASTEARVVHLVLGVTQRRLTTPARLREAIEALPRQRWRKLIGQLLADVADGVTTPLELRYKRDVEQPHGLPRPTRNRSEPVPGRPSRAMYRDVRYRRWRVVVELDGRAAHPEDEEFRDLDRDNLTALGQELTLRYGWRDVVRRPCEVAGQVARGLRLNGWTGPVRPCSPTCRAGASTR